jgi:acetylornithine/succinyldiaminopimelate/putrescine aminotransferase
MGARFTELLMQVPQIEAVRGAGLLLGAQLVEDISAPDVYRALIAKGLICNAVNASTLRFLPPVTVSEGELIEATALIAEALQEASS